MAHRVFVGVVAALCLVIGVASAQTPPARSQGAPVPKEGPEVAALRVKATAGEADAQYSLAVRYSKGEGVPKDDTVAAVWYRRAAELGNTLAQVSLGIFFNLGQGVPKDYEQAAAWYRRAGEQGMPEAQFLLGQMYVGAQGFTKNPAQAAVLYRKAAEQGYPAAQFALGRLYADGGGLSQDYVAAYMWENLAASRAIGDEQRDYAQSRDGLEKLMTPAQIAEAQKLSREWLAAFENRTIKVTR